MGTVIDRSMTTAIGRSKAGTFESGNKIGHRFQKGNRTAFKAHHPWHQPPSGSPELTRLKKRLVRALKLEYGPELTGSQLAYIDSAAEAGARLQLQPESAHPLAIANLMDAQRHALQALEGD
jgi:hypothetical protein